jgi:NAD-dependent dihydropyrimidine dehydrogenase PreA subunit
MFVSNANAECEGSFVFYRMMTQEFERHYVPQVDRRRCEAKAACVAVCPYDVFEIGPIDETEYRALPLLPRLKVWAHGKRTAHTPRADACRACGLCVSACPERALKLTPRVAGP